MRDVTSVPHKESVGAGMLWSSHVATWGVALLQRWLHESARLCREVSFFCDYVSLGISWLLHGPDVSKRRSRSSTSIMAHRVGKFLARVGRWLSKLVSVYLMFIEILKRYCVIEY